MQNPSDGAAFERLNDRLFCRKSPHMQALRLACDAVRLECHSQLSEVCCHRRSYFAKTNSTSFAGGGRSLIAAGPSRPECCPARVMVLSAVSRAAATSGPVRKCGHCKVHNGLTRDRVPTA